LMKHFLPLLILPFLFWTTCEDNGEDSTSSDDGNNLVEDCAGVLGGNNVCGCTDENSFNYDSDATYDDGSCVGIEGNWEVSQYRSSENGAWENPTWDREYTFTGNICRQYDSGVNTSTLYYCYLGLTNYITFSTSSSNTDCTTCYPLSASIFSWVIGIENTNTITITVPCGGFAVYRLERQ